MKKFLSILLLFLILSSFAVRQAQTKCPFGGRVNCTGQCGLFEDKNGDGFCDNGIVQKNDAQKTDAKATSTNPSKTTAKSKQVTKSTAKKETSNDTKNIVRKSDTSAQSTTTQVITTDTASHSAPEAAPVTKTKKPYSLVLISAITLALYAFTAILVKAGKMRKATHRRIWNVVLLITGLVSCLLGFFLVIQLNYHIGLDAMRTIRYYHVQFGIAMTIVAVIHILWHLNYFRSIFKKNQ